MYYADSSTSLYVAVSTSAQTITLPAGQRFLFSSDCTVMLQQGASPTATAGNGSVLVPANTVWLVDVRNGVKLSVLGFTTGHASLARAGAS